MPCPLYDKAKETLEALLSEYKQAAVDGLSFSEIMQLVFRGTAGVISIIDEFAGPETTLQEKLDCMKMAIARFYDEVVAPIDIKAIPNMIEGLVDQAIREIIVLAAEALGQQILDWLGGRSEPAPEPPVEDDPTSKDGPIILGVSAMTMDSLRAARSPRVC